MGGERLKVMEGSTEWLTPDSYFFQLINRMVLDVELQKDSEQRNTTLIKFKSIKREATEMSKSLGAKEEKKITARGKGFGSQS